MIKSVSSFLSSKKSLEGKNVCMLTREFLPHYGGTETLVDTLSKELANNKINVHILTRSHPRCKKEEIENGIHITRTDFLSNIKSDKNEFFDFLVDYFERNKIDIVHTHSIHKDILPLTAVIYSVALKSKIPIIFHMHLPVEGHEARFALSTFSWDYVIPVSSWIARQVYECGISPSKIKTIPNFVDINRFRSDINNESRKEKLINELDIDEEKNIIITPSRLLLRDQIDERKSIDTMIHGLSHLSKEMDFQAVITAIENKYYPKKSKQAKKRLWEMAEVFEVDDKIRIPKENLPQEYIPALYSLADVVALPSYNEPFGLVYAEGMSSGKPVIGTTTGAAPEIIQHGATGLLVEPKSPFALFQALKKILCNEAKAKEYGKNGRSAAIKKYSVSKRINDFLVLYRKLLK